ncbi:MAG: N-acetylneuraminate synthase [Parvibaculaceae bacterium]
MTHVAIIAEAGVNHNGSLERAVEMVDVAADAGVDMVKFQTFNAAALATAAAPKAAYQTATTDAAESQLEMLRTLELDGNAHRVLIERCEEKGIRFLSSPFDLGSLDLLARDLKLPLLKIGSGELTNAPLLHAAAASGCDIILSTGMATLDEIEASLGVIAHGYAGTDGPSVEAFCAAYDSESGGDALRSHVTLLHCTSAYPTPDHDINLRAIETLRTAFGLPVGFSDHSEGIVHSVASVAMGATVIEKHFTLDRSLPGPDHKASLEPSALCELVDGVRRVSQGLGNGIKAPLDAERGNIPIGRKSLVANRPIAAGDVFTTDNLTVKRPGTGLDPALYWSLLGTHAARAYDPDDLIVQ